MSSVLAGDGVVVQSFERGVEWREPANDLWVGSLHGSFVGMIEEKDGRFFVSGPVSQYLGEYPSLDRAKWRLSELALRIAF